MPTDQILRELKCIFSKWKSDDDICFTNGDAEFHLCATKQLIRVDYYSMSEVDLNKIIDVLLKYDCPLYDSLIDVRFDEY